MSCSSPRAPSEAWRGPAGISVSRGTFYKWMMRCADRSRISAMLTDADCGSYACVRFIRPLAV